MIIDIYNVTEQNANRILSRLYKDRDQISEQISACEAVGIDTLALVKTYEHICDTITQVCEFRKTHDCLLEGDPGFSF